NRCRGSGTSGCCRSGLGRHGHAVLNALQSFDDNLLTGLDTVFDDPEGVHLLAHLDGAEGDFVGVNDGQGVDALELLNGALRHEEGASLSIKKNAHTTVLPWPENLLRIREDELHAEGTGRRIDRALDGVDLARLRIATAVSQPQFDALSRPTRRLARSSDLPGNAQVVSLGHANLEEDRIDLRDRRQQRALATAHEVAGFDLRRADEDRKSVV